MVGNHLKAYSDIPQWVRLCCVFFIVVFLCILLYWWILAPVISRLFISESCIYQGYDYYINESYLEFEDGKVFKKMLSRFIGPEKGEVVDFYYINNYIEDNPIYGKMCDVYALDVRLQLKDFEFEKVSVINSAVTHQRRGDFVSYALPVSNEKVMIISFCDKRNTVRYIMITELDSPNGFYQVLDLHTNLDW